MTNENALQQFNNRKNKHLFFSVILDLLGMATYLIPLLGEFGDIIFAPFYGLAIFVMYRRRIFSAAIGGVVGVVEEILPGMDIIPTATFMWVYTYVIRKNKSLNRFVKETNAEQDALNQLRN